jgi:hypothetical protein
VCVLTQVAGAVPRADEAKEQTGEHRDVVVLAEDAADLRAAAFRQCVCAQ